MSKREYIIPFVGLKLGVHAFDFHITDAFFEAMEYSLIQKGDVAVTLELEKKETMMIGNFSVKGTVETACDRCTEAVSVPVKGSYQLIYKFDDHPSDDESLIVVYPEEFELDVRDSIHEFITVSMPSRTVHKEGECDEEMMRILSEYALTEAEYAAIEERQQEDDEEEEEDASENDDQPVDPRWNALKKLRDNNDNLN